MNRRTFLHAGGLVGVAGLAGCSGVFRTEPAGQPPVLENRPDAVYFPPHVEGMAMAGMAESGDYAFGLMYSYPHRFWNVNGTSVQLTDVEEGDDVHLMAAVWDPETETVLPETGLSVEIERDGELVSQEVIYPMLSQPMGFHYGANFGLDGDGTYDVTVSVGGMPIRRTGAFRGTFGSATSVTVPFDYSRAKRDEITYRNTPETAGSAAAVEPMGMGMVPTGFAADVDARASATSGDATVELVTRDAPEGVDAPVYLAAVMSTPYNRMAIPAAGLEATLTRNGDPVFEGELARTLDPELGYHYGAGVDSVEPGDTLAIEVTTPPQVARHEGYETAFLHFEPMEVTL